MPNALVLWKPVEKALVLAEKKSPQVFQTFLNRVGNALGIAVPQKNWSPALKTAVTKAGKNASQIKLVIASAASAATLSNADDIRNALMANEPDSVLRASEELAASSLPSLDDILGPDRSCVRGIENYLVDEATRTVEESLMICNDLVPFFGSVKAARRVVTALRAIELKDFDVYERINRLV